MEGGLKKESKKHWNDGRTTDAKRKQGIFPFIPFFLSFRIYTNYLLSCGFVLLSAEFSYSSPLQGRREKRKKAHIAFVKNLCKTRILRYAKSLEQDWNSFVLLFCLCFANTARQQKNIHKVENNLWTFIWNSK